MSHKSHRVPARVRILSVLFLAHRKIRQAHAAKSERDSLNHLLHTDIVTFALPLAVAEKEDTSAHINILLARKPKRMEAVKPEYKSLCYPTILFAISTRPGVTISIVNIKTNASCPPPP